VGLKANNPLIQNRENWLGRNWLGEILTEVRETLKVTKDSFQVLAAEVRETLRLWDEGMINRLELFGFISDSVAKAKENRDLESS